MDTTSPAAERRAQVAESLWSAVSNSMLGSAKTLNRPVPQGYVPIRIGVFEGEATMVELCRVNFDAHSEEPWRYPMFRDLVALCSPRDQIMRSLGELSRNVPLHDAPAGLIFHESRVGSTLLCNMLAADKDNIVYSESHPLPQVALHCPGCDRAMQVLALQVLVNAMANVPDRKRVFVKFQSANSPVIDLYREAFPNVPFIFLYREPTEVLVSHFFHGSKVEGEEGTRSPVCARTAKSAPTGVRALIQGNERPSAEQYCAAYLAHLCAQALRSIDAAGNLGAAINYANLRDVFMSNVLPKHFAVTVSENTAAKMLAAAELYSKARTEEADLYEDDSRKKASLATPSIKKWAQEYMSPIYVQLEDRYQKFLTKRPEANVVDRAMERSGLWEAMRHKNVGLPPNTLFSKEADLDEYLPYPPLQPLGKLLKEWPPDEIDGIAEGTLPRFDYSDEKQRAEASKLQLHEVPFMIYNVPNIDEVRQKWSDDEYLKKKFGKEPRSVTVSDSNHFMYYHRGKAQQITKNYEPPTRLEKLRFDQWLTKAYEMESAGLNDTHFYLQLNAVGPDEWITRDLTAFEPQKSFFMVEPHANRGINCRFGARGIIAEAHYDGGRNFVAMLRGAKRYILLPPSECENLYLYERGHPEARHSKADWSQPDYRRFPKLKAAKAAQVIVRAGEVLYIPSYWFHYIVAIGLNAQCNTRSGNAIRGRADIADCGFY